MKSLISSLIALLGIASVGVTLTTPILRPQPANLRVRQEDPSLPLDYSETCGEIVSLVNSGSPIFYAIDAYHCLTSVPFNADVGARFRG
jgi:hypothetical protein